VSDLEGDRDRAVGFLRRTYVRRVEHVEYHPWGMLLVTPSLPRIHDANFAIVERWEEDADRFVSDMDRIQAEHGFFHRKVVIHDEDLAGRLLADAAPTGWGIHRSLLMAQRREPDRSPDPAVELLTVGDVDWARGRQALLQLEEYGSDPEVVEQLLQLDVRLERELDVRRLAARDGDGELGSFAALYLEADIGQIEDVATVPAHRGRGLARAVVLHGAAEARRAGAALVFLVADEADWPQELYERLGFDTIGVEHVVSRPAGQDS
jgi:N-acetylglutamate synthase-like GNAT family acetyltransferase